MLTRNSGRRLLGSRVSAAALAAACALGSSRSAVADGHLPVIDIVPVASWTTTSDGIDINGGPRNPSPTNGYVQINGTATIPIVKNVSASYDRISDSVFDAALSSVSIGGHTIYPGSTRDVLQTFRGDYHSGSFTVEGGLAMRHRSCCPAGSYDWHKDYLGLTYVTPSIKQLDNLFFSLNITGNTAKHYSSPMALAAIPAGLDLPNQQLFATQQSATAILPIDPKHGFVTSATYLWGATDFPQNLPFPNYFGVFILSASKQFDPTLGFTVNFVNLKQREQGSPFPSPYGIDNSSLDVLLDVHLDFNKIVTGFSRTRRPASQVPGSPGAPGGPRPPQSTPAQSPAPSAAPS